MIGKLSIEDALFVQTVNLPAAGANVTSLSLDLGNSPTNNSPGCMEIVVECPALATLPQGATVTLTVEESADNINFVPQSTLAAQVITGPANGGSASFAKRFHLPSTALRYIALGVAVSGAAGNQTALAATLKAKF